MQPLMLKCTTTLFNPAGRADGTVGCVMMEPCPTAAMPCDLTIWIDRRDGACLFDVQLACQLIVRADQDAADLIAAQEQCLTSVSKLLLVHSRPNTQQQAGAVSKLGGCPMRCLLSQLALPALRRRVPVHHNWQPRRRVHDGGEGLRKGRSSGVRAQPRRSKVWMAAQRECKAVQMLPCTLETVRRAACKAKGSPHRLAGGSRPVLHQLRQLQVVLVR